MKEIPNYKEVPFYKRSGKKIICGICPQSCELSEGQSGLCFGRKVINNKLIAVNYCEVVSSHLDPIEKKPLYHYKPGSNILSLGPNGCNLSCKWCQNSEISQSRIPTRYLAADILAEEATKNDSIGIAYTYSEPLIWYETLQDVMPLVRQRGGKNILVTNGFIEEEPLSTIVEFIDAANIDLKCYSEEFYKKNTGGSLATVLNNIKLLHSLNVHIEITHLMVSGIVNHIDAVRDISTFIAELSPDIPLHLSRYFPRYKWKEPATPEKIMIEAREVAMEKLNFVYAGNIRLHNASNTYCPECDKLVISRDFYSIDKTGVNIEGNCSYCGCNLNIVS